MKETAKYVLVLFFICFVAALLLTIVHAFTEPRIEKTRESGEASALKEVLPEAKTTKKIQDKEFSYYLALGDKGKTIGYIFICEAKGYSSIIRAMVSVDTDVKIINVKILEQKETPGIGSKITDENFLNRFKGKRQQDTIDSITGATVSSSGLIKSIKETQEKLSKNVPNN